MNAAATARPTRIPPTRRTARQARVRRSGFTEGVGASSTTPTLRGVLVVLRGREGADETVDVRVPPEFVLVRADLPDFVLVRAEAAEARGVGRAAADGARRGRGATGGDATSASTAGAEDVNDTSSSGLVPIVLRLRTPDAGDRGAFIGSPRRVSWISHGPAMPSGAHASTSLPERGPTSLDDTRSARAARWPQLGSLRLRRSCCRRP